MGAIISQHPGPRVGTGEHALERGILRAVAYADIFDFPLTALEIHRYLIGTRASIGRVRSALAAMVPERLERCDGHYCLPGRGELIERRRRRTAAAARLWPQARLYGHRIASLPFVRMVAVTGSLARHNVECGADVDYLIVAERGRVWVCRALVGLFTRWASWRGVTLCANYYVADDALSLRERNVYTAHELVQMVPLAGAGAYRRIRRENAWVAEFLPNAADQFLDAPDSVVGPIQPGPAAEPDGAPASAAGRSTAAAPDGHPKLAAADVPLASALAEMNGGRARRLAESALRSRAGAWLERLERERKLRKSIRQGHDLSEARFDPDCFKGHFDGHARRALAAYAERVRSLENGGV